jgi:dihydroxyacetone kinase-like protein
MQSADLANIVNVGPRTGERYDSGEETMETASQHLIAMFQQLSEEIGTATDHLTELDGAIGDSDHGITMKLGFDAVSQVVSNLPIEQQSISAIFRAAASTFLDAAGASTGPLYSSAFKTVADYLTDVSELDTHAQLLILEGIVYGIQKRGRANRGEKTMLDAWIPALKAAHKAVSEHKSANDLWSDILIAAEAGASETSSMTATKGRAAHLGERSLGHIDPGAASAIIILEVMASTFSVIKR